MTLKEAVLVAEKLDFEFDFGWRNGSPLRTKACFQYGLQPPRRTGPQFKSARHDQFRLPLLPRPNRFQDRRIPLVRSDHPVELF
jgi:hypothetical protein